MVGPEKRVLDARFAVLILASVSLLQDLSE